MGLSLWLVPAPSTAEKIRTAMRIKPTTTTCPSSFPLFHPHVTLATQLKTPSSEPSELQSDPTRATPESLLAALPPAQRAIPVRFRSLEVGDKYFMSVFLAVHSPPGSPLETLRAHLRASLGHAAVPPLAHLSLYYIDDGDSGERERTARELRSGGLPVRVLETGPGEEPTAALACARCDGVEDGQDPKVIDGFEGREIWLVKCDGPVRDWEVLERISLLR